MWLLLPLTLYLLYEQLTIEESKEADTASRQASHRLSRGLHNKVVYLDVMSGCAFGVFMIFCLSVQNF